MTWSSMDVGYALELTMYFVVSEETVDNVYEKVGEFFREECPNISGSRIGRAYRIGSEYKSYRNKKKCCSIIVHFMSFRKRLKDVRVKLDLTKRKYGILKMLSI